MLRTARQRAGITQAELGSRAGTYAPTVSAYEHGVRQPSTDVLLRLLAAAGYEPVLVRFPSGNHRYVDGLCAELADRARTDPNVIELAKTGLAEMRPSDNMRAWSALLDSGPAAVVEVLTSREPEVRSLKADNPFARLGLVAEDVRLALLDAARGR